MYIVTVSHLADEDTDDQSISLWYAAQLLHTTHTHTRYSTALTSAVVVVLLLYQGVDLGPRRAVAHFCHCYCRCANLRPIQPQ